MRDRVLRDGFLILSVVFVMLRLLAINPWGDSVDAYAYWTTRDGSYYDLASTGGIGAYLYSPAFAQLLAPFVALPLNVFLALVTAVNCAALWFLLRRWSLPSLLFLPIPFEIVSGNVHLLLGVAIVLGFQRASAWTLMFITKLTPGIGVIWFLARREWRALVFAVASTLAVVSVSIALDPSQWAAWVQLLRSDPAAGGVLVTPGWYLPIALAPRLVVSGALIAWAATKGQRWIVPIGVLLAMPVIWFNSFAVLAACVPLAAGIEDLSRTIRPGAASNEVPRADGASA